MPSKSFAGKEVVFNCRFGDLVTPNQSSSLCTGQNKLASSSRQIHCSCCKLFNYWPTVDMSIFSDVTIFHNYSHCLFYGGWHTFVSFHLCKGGDTIFGDCITTDIDRKCFPLVHNENNECLKNADSISGSDLNYLQVLSLSAASLLPLSSAQLSSEDLHQPAAAEAPFAWTPCQCAEKKCVIFRPPIAKHSNNKYSL